MAASKAIATIPGQYSSDQLRDSPLEYVRTLFVTFIQGLFHAAQPGQYHWDPESELSQIRISDENPVKTENCGTNPAITVTRGPVAFHSVGMDDMLDYDPRTGKKTKGVIVPGTMVINCCSRVDLECDRLAWIVAEELWMNRELLIQAGFFEIGRQPTIGSPSPAGSLVDGDNADEWYCTSISCPFQFTRTSSVTPLGKKIIQGIDLALRARMAVRDPRQEGWPSSGGPSYPVYSQGYPPPPFAPHASDVYGGSPNPGSPPQLLPVVPHPLNPSQMVVVRSVRPYGPGVNAGSIGARSIPITRPTVEESCGKQMDSHVTDRTTVKV